ncbi:MAG: TetR family transcriptional regulator C-terminal domain-containing protein [Saccharofermentans sp.]|nr:TetR family transcriptional regulator C-terminal domain-containing protein [Saccharofermentans sp.]
MDRRQKRSRKVICEALLTLMKDKPIEEITIKELTDVADVNRKTFYNNYGSIMDVKHDLEDNLIMLFFSLVNADNIEDKIVEADLNPGRLVHRLIRVIDEDRAKSRMIFDSGESTILLRHLRDMMNPYILSLAREHNVTESEVEYALYFIASGTMSVIKAWLNDEITASSLEMENILITLIRKVIRN